MRISARGLQLLEIGFLAELSDDAIDMMIACFARCPTPMGQCSLSTSTALLPGSVSRHGLPAPYGGLQLPRSLPMDKYSDTDACIAWARETYAEMQPFVASGRYVNYLDDDEAGDAVPTAYGANYRRLQELKTKYDPQNFFRMNQNIRPLA